VLELLNNPMEINATQRLAWLNTGIVDICSITDITIVMSKCPQQFSCGISTPVFSKISLSGLVFDRVKALF
jgi:hypothetical protein